MSPGKAWVLALALPLVGSGCATRLDMGKLYDQSAATTIPYSGVRGARQFPDYEPIGRSILTGKDPEAAVKPAKPKGGAR